MFAFIGRFFVACLVGALMTASLLWIVVQLFPQWFMVCPMGCSQSDLAAADRRDMLIALLIFGATSATVLTMVWNKP
jgi:hypothetical protein